MGVAVVSRAAGYWLLSLRFDHGERLILLSQRGAGAAATSRGPPALLPLMLSKSVGESGRTPRPVPLSLLLRHTSNEPPNAVRVSRRHFCRGTQTLPAFGQNRTAFTLVGVA
jgi:hypothetical protein